MNVVDLEDEAPYESPRRFKQLSPVFSSKQQPPLPAAAPSRDNSASPRRLTVAGQADSRDYNSADASIDDVHGVKRLRSASPDPGFESRRRLSRSPLHPYNDIVEEPRSRSQERTRSPRLNDNRSLSRERSRSPRRQQYQSKDRSSPRRRSREREDRRDDRREERPRGRDHSTQEGSWKEKRRISPSERGTPKPSKTLGVFGLSILTHERDLDTLFRPFGRIESISVLKDKITGKSRGYGFITFEDVESATKAIAGMNGVMYNDRQMRVDYTLSTKRVESPSRDGRDSRRRASSPQSRTGHHSLPAVPLHYPGMAPPTAGAAGTPPFPYPMPYGYYPYPYGYPFAPTDPAAAAAAAAASTGGESKDGRKKEAGDVTTPAHVTPILYYDPRNPNPLGAMPPGGPGSAGVPGAAPFPFGIPPGYPPPFMFDPRHMVRGGSSRRDSSRDRYRDSRGAGGGGDRRRDRSRERGGDDRRRRPDSPDGRRDYRDQRSSGGEYRRRSRDRDSRRDDKRD